MRPYFHTRSANVTSSSVSELRKRRKVKTSAGFFFFFGSSVVSRIEIWKIAFSADTLRFHYKYCFVTARNCVFLPNRVLTNQKTGGELWIYVF